jgi:phosphate transport system substrate-binding protein
MNDDFLHRLRKAPPPEFLDGLKERLDRQSPPVEVRLRRPRRFPFARGLFIGLLLGSAAFAITSLSVNRSPASLADFFKAPAQLLARSGGPSQDDDGQHHRGAPLGPVWLPKHGAAPATQSEGLPDASAAALPGTSPTGEVAKARSSLTQPGSPSTNPLTNPYGTRVVATVGAYPHASSILERSSNGRLKVSLDKNGTAFASLCEEDLKNKGSEFAELTHRVAPADLRNCRYPITELKVGHQAVVLARSKLYGPMKVSARDLFLALARQIPVPTDPTMLMDNPNTTWNQVDGSLPYDYIRILGPMLGSVQGRLAAALLLEAGCNTYPWIAALRSTDTARYEEICTSARIDGVYEESPLGLSTNTENLERNPTVLGIMTLTEFEWAKDRVVASPIDNIEAAPDTVAADTYPASRTLYLYTNTDARFLNTNSLVSAFLELNRYGTYSTDWGWGFITLDAAEHAEIDATLKRKNSKF